MRPKVPAQPSTAQSQPRLEEPDPVSYPHRWIHAKLMTIDHLPWWKELKASSRMAMGYHIISEGLIDHEALHWACWPQDCGMPHPDFADSWHIGFLTHTDVSSPRDFWAVRQEKTLALAWVLQVCAKESEFPTGVLCESGQELQKCMAPLMALSSDEIVETFLLRHTGEEHQASPTQEEEATLLGKVEPPQVLEQLEVHDLVQPCRVNCHSCSLSSTPSFPTKSPPFPEGKEVPARDQCKHNQCWPVGPCLLRGEW